MAQPAISALGQKPITHTGAESKSAILCAGAPFKQLFSTATPSTARVAAWANEMNLYSYATPFF
jgi:hypothetical protein